MELPGRGTTFVRSLPGPAGAPTVVLLHGWTATADLNWFTCYRPLAEHYRVIALDHRGHGRGIRSRKTFRLEDCADDAVAVCDVLGIEQFIPIGYSMGGPVAQLIWQRHQQRTAGLVLCATSAYFATSREERLSFLGLSGLAAVARLTPLQARQWLTDQFYLQKKADLWEPWAINEAAMHDWRAVLEAGRAIGNFSSREWITEIDVPTSTLITMRDRVVPVRRQVRLFEAIPDAEAFRVDGDHDAVVAHAKQFVPTLLRAIRSVVERSR
jgi:3-oxoadipate enol-lactonase